MAALWLGFWCVVAVCVMIAVLIVIGETRESDDELDE
jgi:hypothetical protein